MSAAYNFIFEALAQLLFTTTHDYITLRNHQPANQPPSKEPNRMNERAYKYDHDKTRKKKRRDKKKLIFLYNSWLFHGAYSYVISLPDS